MELTLLEAKITIRFNASYYKLEPSLRYSEDDVPNLAKQCLGPLTLLIDTPQRETASHKAHLYESRVAGSISKQACKHNLFWRMFINSLFKVCKAIEAVTASPEMKTKGMKPLLHNGRSA